MQSEEPAEGENEDEFEDDDEDDDLDDGTEDGDEGTEDGPNLEPIVQLQEPKEEPYSPGYNHPDSPYGDDPEWQKEIAAKESIRLEKAHGENGNRGVEKMDLPTGPVEAESKALSGESHEASVSVK